MANNIFSSKFVKYPYIVAELSGNHKQNFDEAVKLIRAAKESGADAVKLQTYTADTLTINSDRKEFIIDDGIWKGNSLYDLYKIASTPWEWHEELFRIAKQLNITIFSSPFDSQSIDYLENLDCPIYKIASPELIDLPLIEKAAQTGKPLILSTGMANDQEINEAVEIVRSSGCKKYALLHCVSAYPAQPDQSNLKCITKLYDKFKCITGLSDHTTGISVPIAAAALGAKIIEKHLTLSRGNGAVDSIFSIEPDELTKVVKTTKIIYQGIGDGSIGTNESEINSLKYRRSIYATEDIKKGDFFSEKNIASIRPSFGLPPKYIPKLYGTRSEKTIKKGQPLDLSMVGKRLKQTILS